VDYVTYRYDGECTSNPNVPMYLNPGMGRLEAEELAGKAQRRLRWIKAIQHPVFTIRKIMENPSLLRGLG